MEKLERLAFIVFAPHQNLGVPGFVNVKNRPYLDLSNNNIVKMDKAGLKLLKQYSIVNLQFNPIVKNDLERKKFSGMHVLFDSTDVPPQDILKYYRGA